MKSLILALILALPITAFGDTINIVLLPGTLSGNPGDTVNFFGTLTNTTSSVQFLNSAQISGLLPSFTGDINPFFLNTPASLTGNEVVTNVELFDIIIPLSIAAGPYVGTFSIFGGADDNANVGLGSFTFTVDVNSSVPEPQTLGLTFAALAVLRTVRYKRVGRQQKRT